jgi:tRNA pseudouridine38-40 synthase
MIMASVRIPSATITIWTISFELAWRHDGQTLLRAINAYLPDDIALVSLSGASPSFHPRFDARRRVYQYYIYNQPVRSPLHRLYSWHVKRPLDLEAMNAAAAHLPGTHDFATFGRPTQGDSTVRELFRADWRQDGNFIVFEVEGNAFLYRMVRSLVGALCAVGRHDWTVDDFVAAFRAADRSIAATTAPACGLVLVSVSYDE